MHRFSDLSNALKPHPFKQCGWNGRRNSAFNLLQLYLVVFHRTDTYYLPPPYPSLYLVSFSTYTLFLCVDSSFEDAVNLCL